MTPTSRPVVRPAWRRLGGWTLGALLGFSALFPPLYAAFTPEERGVPTGLPSPLPGTYRVYIADWGYHTAIIVEQPRGWALGPLGEERAPFLEYAWGDRRFYLESDYRPHALFATMALPTSTVLYVEGRSDRPRLAGARAVFMRTVDAPTLHALLVALERSVRHTPDGARVQPYPHPAGYGGQFYPAYGEYLWARDCNWWTVARLAEAGLARRASGVVLSGQVGRRLLGFDHIDTRAPAS